MVSKFKVVAGAVCLLCAGWASAATVPGGVKLHDVQELVRGNNSEPDSMDPAIISGEHARNISRNLFEGLTAVNENGRIMPGVAQGWKQTDARVWMFTLRPNLKWSNGDPLTASDFVYSMRRFIDPATASEYASVYGPFLHNGKEVNEKKLSVTELGVRAIDANTLEIKTAYPIGFLPEILADVQFSPVHKTTVEKFGREWTKPANIVTNGAYTLKDWQVNNKIVITKSPSYWDAKNVQLTKVTFLPIEDSNTDVKLYESGESDWIYSLPPGTYEKYKAEYPKDIRNTDMLGIRYYSLNNKDPLFKDIRVRKAFSMVLDRDILAQRVTADGQNPLYGLIPKRTSGAEVTTYDWATWPMEKRVAEAKKLMAEAGVPAGTKVKFLYNTNDYHKKMAIFAASEWKTKLGIDVEMEAVEFKVLLRRRNEKSYQIARNGWTADYNDATTFLTLLDCDSEQNNNNSCNRQASNLVKEGNQLFDAEKRKKILTQAAKLAMDDYPMIPLLQYTMPRLVKPWVGGYSQTNPLDRYRAKDLYIIKH